MIPASLLRDRTQRKCAEFALKCVLDAREIADPGNATLWRTTLDELLRATAAAIESPTDANKVAVMQLRKGTAAKPGVLAQLTQWPVTSAQHALLSSAVMASQTVVPDPAVREPAWEAAAAATMSKEAIERARPELAVSASSPVSRSERHIVDNLISVFTPPLSPPEREVFTEMVSAGWPKSWDAAVAQAKHTVANPITDDELGLRLTSR